MTSLAADSLSFAKMPLLSGRLPQAEAAKLLSAAPDRRFRHIRFPAPWLRF
jgi:hypothetical protein